MKKMTYLYISLVIIFLLMIIGGFRSLIIFKSPEKIRIHLLEITPIGTSINDVNDVIQKENFNLKFLFEKHGYELRDKSGKRIGDKYMRVHIDEYKIIISVDIVAFYVFDKDDNLIEIDVVKFTDSL